MWKREGVIDTNFLFLSLAVLGIGLAVLTSASGPVSFEEHGSSFYFIKEQLLQGVLPGLIAAFIAYRLPYTVWRKLAFPMLAVSVILLVLVFVPGIGTDLNTFAKSWIQIVPGFTFQPSEIVKMTFLFYLAAWMEARGHGVRDVEEGLAPFLVTLGVVGGLIFLQPDLGSLAVILAMAFIVYFAAGASLKHLLGVGVVGILLFIVAVQMAPYRVARLTTFLHPELDPQGVGYQINQALLATGSGGLFGRGFGHSVQKFEYLPEVIGDSIFAVMAEELGFFLMIGFLVLIGVWFSRGIRIAEGAPDPFARYVVIGCLGWIGIQIVMNIGSILGLLPLTGVTLPFVSYGGTSLTMTLFAVGVMLNISRS